MARRPTTGPLSVAPMMDCTDRLFRQLFRQVSQRTLLYTEMLHCRAVLGRDRQRLLRFSEQEHPIALQLGGDSPRELAEAARIGADAGYDEINLNAGCPSERVQSGAFGACLMADPQRCAELAAAMRAAVALPVTVKHRTGIDSLQGLPALLRFVAALRSAGVDRVIIHSRIAILSGLSPRQNRSVPPLQYELVHAVKQAFADLPVEINGGITDLDAAAEQLRMVDGVMIGRAAYNNPWIFAEADARFYDSTIQYDSIEQRRRSFAGYMLQLLAELKAPAEQRALLRHAAGFFHGIRGAAQWRRALNAAARSADPAAPLQSALSYSISALEPTAAPSRQSATA
ncbi:MAG: tRNA dihydrouridine(20/20a) synthase DusA [Leptospirales bacterium]|nr:tRNA dihydrouridine(20/20a) synthase DusA [Leptospirales bacterium]